MGRNSIESWLHNRIANECGMNNQGHRQLFTRQNVEAYHLIKLRQILRYAFEHSTFYRELFDRAGVSPDHVNTLEDLSLLPFTEPAHLAQEPYRFLCTSRAEVARVFSFVTSGTTGPQKKIFWSVEDLERITDFMAVGMAMVAGPEDIIQIILPDGRPYSQADLLRLGVLKLGANPVVADMESSAEDQFELQQSMHSTVIFGYAGQIYRMSKKLEAKHDLKKSGVRALFLAAEYLPEARRKELQNIWNCSVYTHYGLTEMGLGVAVECEAHKGYHFNEVDLLLEVVDPQTGARVESGREGELVFTTLTRRAMPLIRYRTHDLSRLIPETCSCGASTLLRIDSIRKRRESVIFLSTGDELYPALFDEVLCEIPGFIDYQAVLKQRDQMDCLEFKIELVEEKPDSIACLHKNLAAIPALAKNISAGTMLEPSIEIVPWGALKSENRAKKLILDQRGQNQ